MKPKTKMDYLLLIGMVVVTAVAIITDRIEKHYKWQYESPPAKMQTDK